MSRFTVVLAVVSMSLIMWGCEKESPVGAVAEDSVDGVSLLKGGGGSGDNQGYEMFEITFTNLTPAGSQPMSPPVIATHSRGIRMFHVGHAASSELEQIAEDAVNGPMIDLLEASSRVGETVAGTAVVAPGGSATYKISGTRRFSKLSMVSMLVNTNDAFTGIDAARLPRNEKTYYLHSYDAGTEKNTELRSDIPGPCCGNPGNGTPENGVVTRHAGITGAGELSPDVYGWDEPVAKLTIKRMRPKYELKFENLTPAGSQPISPPVVATHHPSFHMFKVGRRASHELEQIAEDAVNGPMLDLLGSSKRVFDYTSGNAPFGPGGSTTLEIEGLPHLFHLSFAAMLVNTNDAFTGADGIALPDDGSSMHYFKAYDAGTESNTELRSHIPGPCCGNPGAGVSESKRIRHHEGITGGGELDPAVYGWDDPVLKLTITRIN